jgi:hypothetical protein
MRPTARGPAQHGGLPGWLLKSDPASEILYVMDEPYRLPFSVHAVRTGCLDRSCLAAVIQYSKCTQPSVMKYVMQGEHSRVLS